MHAFDEAFLSGLFSSPGVAPLLGKQPAALPKHLAGPCPRDLASTHEAADGLAAATTCHHSNARSLQDFVGRSVTISTLPGRVLDVTATSSDTVLDTLSNTTIDSAVIRVPFFILVQGQRRIPVAPKTVIITGEPALGQAAPSGADTVSNLPPFVIVPFTQFGIQSGTHLVFEKVALLLATFRWLDATDIASPAFVELRDLSLVVPQCPANGINGEDMISLYAQYLGAYASVETSIGGDNVVRVSDSGWFPVYSSTANNTGNAVRFRCRNMTITCANDKLFLNAIREADLRLPRTGMGTLDCYDPATEGRFYRGNVAVTRRGLPCQSWSVDEPAGHWFKPELFPQRGLEKAACRNSLGTQDRPWCLTSEWPIIDVCNVPACTAADLVRPSNLVPLNATELPADDKDRPWLIPVIATLAAVIVLLAAAMALLFVRRRRRRNTAHAQERLLAKAAAAGAGGPSGSPGGAAALHLGGPGGGGSVRGSETLGSSRGIGSSGASSLHSDGFRELLALRAPGPGAAAPSDLAAAAIKEHPSGEPDVAEAAVGTSAAASLGFLGSASTRAASSAVTNALLAGPAATPTAAPGGRGRDADNRVALAARGSTLTTDSASTGSRSYGDQVPTGTARAGRERATAPLSPTAEMDALRSRDTSPRQTLTSLAGTWDSDIKIGRTLGRGSFGCVYDGLWHDTRVAVKVIEYNAQMRDAVNPRLEASLSKELSHPNVVTTYDYGWAEPAMHALLAVKDNSAAMIILMEYCNLRSLTVSVRKSDRFGHLSKALNWQAVLYALIDVARGLVYLHDSGIIHGDVKAANVMLKSVPKHASPVKFTAKLADLGLAQLRDSVAKEGIFGTLTHAAPELLATHRSNTQTDVYAFGVLMYELLTGKQPFRGFSPSEVVTLKATRATGDVLAVPPAPGSAVHSALTEIYLACVDHDPAARPKSRDLFTRLRFVASTNGVIKPDATTAYTPLAVRHDTQQDGRASAVGGPSRSRCVSNRDSVELETVGSAVIAQALSTQGSADPDAARRVGADASPAPRPLRHVASFDSSLGGGPSQNSFVAAQNESPVSKAPSRPQSLSEVFDWGDIVPVPGESDDGGCRRSTDDSQQPFSPSEAGEPTLAVVATAGRRVSEQLRAMGPPSAMAAAIEAPPALVPRRSALAAAPHSTKATADALLHPLSSQPSSVPSGLHDEVEFAKEVLNAWGFFETPAAASTERRTRSAGQDGGLGDASGDLAPGDIDDVSPGLVRALSVGNSSTTQSSNGVARPPPSSAASDHGDRGVELPMPGGKQASNGTTPRMSRVSDSSGTLDAFRGSTSSCPPVSSSGVGARTSGSSHPGVSGTFDRGHVDQAVLLAGRRA